MKKTLTWQKLLKRFVTERKEYKIQLAHFNERNSRCASSLLRAAENAKPVSMPGHVLPPIM
jgi:hypothetical protein